jgi:hypothetical protein
VVPNKGVMQKLKRHGNGGSCFQKHEKLKIKIFAERVMIRLQCSHQIEL